MEENKVSFVGNGARSKKNEFGAIERMTGDCYIETCKGVE
jgi:hypothetical protein